VFRYKEIDSAARAKDRLTQALDSKVQPMDLVQQRYHTRHDQRPGREAVHDEVEIALATEFSELNSMVNINIFLCSEYPSIRIFFNIGREPVQ
jgi:hypothetical protein